MAFLKDPKGPPLWEEYPGAKDVVHIDNEKVSDGLWTLPPNQGSPGEMTEELRNRNIMGPPREPWARP